MSKLVRSPRGPWVPVLVFVLALVAALAAVRHVAIMRILALELDCGSCMVLPHAQADMPYLAVFAAVLAAGLVLRGRLVRLACRLLALVMALLYLLDIFVYRSFHTRLDLRDVMVYGDQARLAWRQFVESWSAPAFYALMATAVVTVLACFWLPARRRRGPTKLVWVPLGIAAVALGISLATSPAYPGWWIVRNVVAHNLQTGVAVPYDPGHQARLLEQWRDRPASCLAGRGARPNIIVLIAEGWSPYHSRLFTGFNDWTPRLDQWAEQGRYFTALHAGGSNTNAGLISILLGHEFYSPVKGPLKLRAFDGVWGLETSLAKRLVEQGYHTRFMTNGNLAFSGKGGWLADIGFQDIHGHDAPEYEGRRRLHFDSVADEHLYRKALASLPDEGADPWLLVLENVSSHHPYMHPHSLERNERKAFDYMDQSMHVFIQALAERGFFEDNLLVVLSDHRAMTRVSPEEKQRFGLAAGSRIPGFVLSGLVEAGRVDTPLHQADLLPSLLAMVSGGACARRPVADMLHDVTPPPRCLMHAPNSDWNSVQAYCPDGQRVVRLKGSDSLIASGAGDPAGLLDDVAVRRMDPTTYEVVPAAAPALADVAPPVRPAVPDPERIKPPAPQQLAQETVDPAVLPARGGCNIERLNSYAIDGERMRFRPASDFVISGWLVDDEAGGIAPDARLVLSSLDGHGRFRVDGLLRTPREDIVASRGSKRFEDAGFRALVPRLALPPGDYDLALVYASGGDEVSCGLGRGLSILGAPPRAGAAAAPAESTSPAAGS